MDLDAEIDALYGLAPDAFVPARADLAKRAKAEIGKEAADQVKALRRPVAALWAVNQLWRRAPERFRALLDTGDRVRAVQATRDRPREALGEALSAQRELVRDLLDEAAAILEEGDFAVDTNLERVRANLAALSAWGTDLPLRPGRLEADVEPPGFEALLNVAPRARPTLRLVEPPEPEPARPQPPPKPRKAKPAPRGPSAAELRAHAAAKEELATARAAHDRAITQADTARQRLTDAEARTRAAREELARREAEEQARREALAEAESAREAADRAAREAEGRERAAGAHTKPR